MKKTFKFNKLIRDKIHEKMLQQGAEVKLKKLCSQSDLTQYFKAKILEEAEEVVVSKNKEETLEELADLIEASAELSCETASAAALSKAASPFTRINLLITLIPKQ